MIDETVVEREQLTLWGDDDEDVTAKDNDEFNEFMKEEMMNDEYFAWLDELYRRQVEDEEFIRQWYERHHHE